MKDLCTLSGVFRHEQVIRKSRFVAHAAPVADVDSAMAWIADISDPTATHNCWAYCIGQDYRFHDDGEVSGTGGKPILQAIEGQHLDGVAAVVTRWFGGVKLGTGGLIRAYGGTAAECMRRAEHVPIIPTARIGFGLGYAELELFKARAHDWGVQFESEDFGAQGVEVVAHLPLAHLDALDTLLADLSRGACRVRRLD